MTDNNSDVNLHITIGMVVKAWREWRGYTVTQLAERCGRPITKGYVSGLERDKIRQPGDDHLVLLSRALEIPVLYLVARRLPDQVTEATPDALVQQMIKLMPSTALNSPFNTNPSVKDALQPKLSELKGTYQKSLELIADIEELIAQDEDEA
jgi:transcriptional regulator with XRE-family HTH domain